MIHHLRIKRFVPILALGATLAMAATLHAQDRYGRGSGEPSGTIQVNFGSAPHWTEVSGTHVQEIRQGERPDYDMFHYGDTYYVYNNNQWYSSRQWSGSFTSIDSRSVPNELSMVPREHWRQYPSEWQDRNNRGPGGNSYDRGPVGNSANMQVRFDNQPRWNGVRGTRVSMIRQGQRPDYDMFRYGNNYYVYSNNQWYMSRQSRGEFRMIDDRMVPRQIAMVPRNQWRNYPQEWADRNNDSRYGNQGRHRR